MVTTDLRAQLEEVVWIGGGSGGGKSTVARHLADRLGMHLYSTDEAMSRHADRMRTGEAPVIAEGFRLLPHLVAPLSAPGSCVWLLPTPHFRRQAFAARGSLWDIAARTSDPARALANLLERDQLFTDRLRVELDSSGLPALEVDTGATAHDLALDVRQQRRLPVT